MTFFDIPTYGEVALGIVAAVAVVGLVLRLRDRRGLEATTHDCGAIYGCECGCDCECLDAK